MTKLVLSTVAAALASLLCLSSFAAEPMCLALERLASQVKDCQQNVFFVKAARACTAKLEKDIAAQQALLTAAMALTEATSASAQSGRMANSIADLTAMQTTLTGLEDEARRARAEMLIYSQNFTYAGPISHALAKQLHMEGFLSRFNCFAENQALLSTEIKGMDRHIAELDKAIQGAAKLASVNGANEKRLDASSNNAVAHGRSTSSVRPVPAGTAKNGTSSITGTEKIDDDNRALRRLDQK